MPKQAPINNPRPRRIADLEKEIRQLRATIQELEERLVIRERMLLEDGLRLSQENEVLRRKLQDLEK